MRYEVKIYTVSGEGWIFKGDAASKAYRQFHADSSAPICFSVDATDYCFPRNTIELMTRKNLAQPTQATDDG